MNTDFGFQEMDEYAVYNNNFYAFYDKNDGR